MNRDHQGAGLVDVGAPPRGAGPAGGGGSSKGTLIALVMVIAVGVILVAAILAMPEPSQRGAAIGACIDSAEGQGVDSDAAEAWCVASEANEQAAAAEQATVQLAAEEADQVVPEPVSPDGPVPDVIGTDLQSAQDTLRALGYRHLVSIDDTGRGRNQVVDSNWVVVAMTPGPGTRTPTAYEIRLFVVKEGEV